MEPHDNKEAIEEERKQRKGGDKDGFRSPDVLEDRTWTRAQASYLQSVCRWSTVVSVTTDPVDSDCRRFLKREQAVDAKNKGQLKRSNAHSEECRRSKCNIP